MTTQQNNALHTFKERVEQFLNNLIEPEPKNVLNAAMRYSTLQGGKRLRPKLIYACGSDLNINLHQLDHAAAAIELIHCFSLVHDDLPAMDDDDLRRGQPTCHRQFDEATAILTGDALQTLAFNTLTQAPLPNHTKILLIEQLCHATGRQGMIQGQQLDMLGEGQSLSLSQIEHIHQLKTGALIQCAISMAATIANCEPNILIEIKKIGSQLGLAFQIQNDLLDIASTTLDEGKNTGTDVKHNKSTYPAVLGKQKTTDLLTNLSSDIQNSFQSLSPSMPLLQQVAYNALERCHKLVK